MLKTFNLINGCMFNVYVEKFQKLNLMKNNYLIFINHKTIHNNIFSGTLINKIRKF